MLAVNVGVSITMNKLVPEGITGMNLKAFLGQFYKMKY